MGSTRSRRRFLENKKKITVRGLIEMLRDQDPEARVFLADWNEAYADPLANFELRVTDTGDVLLDYPED